MSLLKKLFGELIGVICVLAVLQRDVVQPSPVNTSHFPGNDDVAKAATPNFDEVKQLEDLKQSLGKTFSVLKAHSVLQFADETGPRESHEESREDALSDGKIVAHIKQNVDTVEDAASNATPATHVHTEIDVPASDVHKVVDETLNPKLRQAEMMAKRNHRPGIDQLDNKYSMYRVQYSPRDMAEYVFWTGDEKRVTLAIEEFLEAGQMTREEAISFLQEIKTNLDYLETHYSRQDMFRRHDQYPEDGTKDRMRMMQQQAFTKPSDDFKSSNIGLEKKDSMDRSIPLTPPVMQDEPSSPSRGNQKQLQDQNQNLSEEDYAELLERLKVADYLYTEYSLEEVIYQLAKVMFAQSITRGSNEAQEALQTFTNYLANEADMGRISKGLQKKVLDVLIASLTDTLAEHPKAMSAALLNLAPKEASTVQSASMILHQILMLNPREPNVQAAPMIAPRLDKLNGETMLGEHQSLHGNGGNIIDVGKRNKISLSTPVGKAIKMN